MFAEGAERGRRSSGHPTARARRRAIVRSSDFGRPTSFRPGSPFAAGVSSPWRRCARSRGHEVDRQSAPPADPAGTVDTLGTAAVAGTAILGAASSRELAAAATTSDTVVSATRGGAGGRPPTTVASGSDAAVCSAVTGGGIVGISGRGDPEACCSSRTASSCVIWPLALMSPTRSGSVLRHAANPESVRRMTRWRRSTSARV
jgi:hypothetical protein